MEIKGVQAVIGKMRDMAAKALKDANVQVRVGFSAKYALYVHENTLMKLQGRPRASGRGVYWGPHGQAKFLEQPFREMQSDLIASVVTDIAKGLTTAQALLRAGLRLQRAAMQLVPVDTGHLRASAFTRLETV